MRTLQCGGAHPPLLWGCALPFVHNDEFSSTLMEQRTLDAIGVLIISTTAGGGVLGRLRCNVDSEGGKYTSATPRCTCLPPYQHCAEVALGRKQVHLGYASVYLLSSSCNFSSSTPRPSSSTPRLRLGVLELGLSVLERSRPSTPPPAVVLIPMYFKQRPLAL